MSVEDLANEFEVARKAGERYINSRWNWLDPATTLLLVETGYYSAAGTRQQVDVAPGSAPFKDCERLEYALGVLVRCVTAKLPLRTQTGEPIPAEALNDEVPRQAEELLAVRLWRDPAFLRLALCAVAKHQLATALSMVSPEPRALARGCLAEAARGAVILLMPAALALGVSSAVSHQLVEAVVWFYILGAGAFALRAGGKRPKREPDFELSHDLWLKFDLSGGPGQTGLGAVEKLRAMQALGLQIPTIAFDLADSLRSRSS